MTCFRSAVSRPNAMVSTSCSFFPSRVSPACENERGKEWMQGWMQPANTCTFQHTHATQYL